MGELSGWAARRGIALLGATGLMAALLVAVAGATLANFFSVYPQVGLQFTVLAYAIVALGGFGSILGTLLAALLVGVIQSVTSTTFTVSINSSGYPAYSSGGTAQKFVQPNELLTWTGQFDVPVRFDIDEMKMVMEDNQILNWEQIPVVELRP